MAGCQSTNWSGEPATPGSTWTSCSGSTLAFPKELAGIFRFQKFYRLWARGLSFNEMKDEVYGYYYDQAHFTREFKKMTGYSPRKFTNEISNQFGRLLSRN